MRAQSFTGPPIQKGLQDRITKRKKSPFGKEDRCICSPCSAESACPRRQAETESPPGLWGKDMFWMRTALVRCFLLSFRKGGQDTAGED